MISGHGDDRYLYPKPVKADFSSNVWFGGTPPELIRHLQQNLHLIGNYPEPDAAGLRIQIAESHSVVANQVLRLTDRLRHFTPLHCLFANRFQLF